MSELVKIRLIAFVSILAAALVLLVALQSTARAESLAVAALGKMTVIAPRIADVAVADLGEMTVIARRMTEVRVASTNDVAFLGAMTVTARRIPDLQVAATNDATLIGAMMVTASRLPATAARTVSARSSRTLQLAQASPASPCLGSSTRAL